jgi:cytochrome c biogenesis protein ResB
MRRNDPEFGSRTIQTSQGPLQVEFVEEQVPLGFSLRLLRFIHGLNPGRMGDASFASLVRLTDTARGVDEEREISMNQPLDYGKFTFYQSSYQEVGDGKYVSVLTAASDPGRPFKYGGCLLICLGILVTISTSSFAPRSARSAA